MIRQTLAAAVLLLAAAACSTDDLDGVVVEKEFEPGYTRVIPVTTCGAKGCTTGTAVDSRPDCYRLVVENERGEVDTACVREARWVLAEVGEQYVGDDVEGDA